MVSINNINNINQYHIPALDFPRMLKITGVRLQKNLPRFWHHFAAVLRFLWVETCDLTELHAKPKIPDKTAQFRSFAHYFWWSLATPNKSHWSLVDNVRVNDPILFGSLVCRFGCFSWWVFRHRSRACFKKWFRVQISTQLEDKYFSHLNGLSFWQALPTTGSLLDWPSVWLNTKVVLANSGVPCWVALPLRAQVFLRL